MVLLSRPPCGKMCAWYRCCATAIRERLRGWQTASTLISGPLGSHRLRCIPSQFPSRTVRPRRWVLTYRSAHHRLRGMFALRTIMRTPPPLFGTCGLTSRSIVATGPIHTFQDRPEHDSLTAPRASASACSFAVTVYSTPSSSQANGDGVAETLLLSGLSSRFERLESCRTRGDSFLTTCFCSSCPS